MTIDNAGLRASFTSTQQEKLNQFVAFELAGQQYCVDIMSVREIRNWGGITQLPNTPDHVMGVINLRGIIVPVIDMRVKFHVGRSNPTSANVVVVVSLHDALHGLLVDSVADIVSCKLSDIVPMPESLGEIQNPLLEGLITVNGEMLAIVSLDRVIESASAAKTIAA
jgi:purine-binding chemotaxis protein CheW